MSSRQNGVTPQPTPLTVSGASVTDGETVRLEDQRRAE